MNSDCLDPLSSPFKPTRERGTEQIASPALHLASDTHLMFTNEFAPETPSSRETGEVDARCKPVKFVSAFPGFTTANREQNWDGTSLV